jgi:branched-chain amino acid transport system permease protein
MTFETFVQSVIFGIFTGVFYGLGAVGFSFVFGVVRILNIAHGDLLMLGGYAAFFLFSLTGIGPFLSLPLVAAVLFLIGMFLYKVLFARAIKLGGELRMNTSLLISFGVILILSQVAILLFTADERSVSPPYAGMGLEVFQLYIPYVRLGSLLVTLIVIFGLEFFLRKTYLGKCIRGSAENWESATLMGIDINRIYLLSFALSCALAGVAGSMVALCYSVSPGIGLEWMLKIMIVTVLAGLGSIGGLFFAGILLGVVEAVSAIYLGPYMEVIGLMIFLLVLLLRPKGLFGRNE